MFFFFFFLSTAFASLYSAAKLVWEPHRRCDIILGVQFPLCSFADVTGEYRGKEWRTRFLYYLLRGVALRNLADFTSCAWRSTHRVSYFGGSIGEGKVATIEEGKRKRDDDGSANNTAAV